ncbi:MAG: hypothetical protein ACK4SX_06500 [Alcanivoracaceae bacterium]
MLPRLILIVSVVALLPACITHAYLPPDGQLLQEVAAPAELRQVAATVSTHKFYRPNQFEGISAGDQAAAVANREASRWFAGPGQNYSVEISNIRSGEETGGWTLAIYLLSLGLLPFTTSQDYQSTLVVKSSSGDEIFRNVEGYRFRGSLALLPTAMFFGMPGHSAANRGTTDQMNRHKLALGQHIAQSRSEYEQAVAAATVDAYRSYLTQHPASFYRRETMARLAALAPEQNPLRFHIDNMALASDYLPFVPADQAIWFIGPPGLRVHEVLTESRRQNEALLAARIRTGGARYKVFSGEEVDRLQRSGLKPELIAAMMEVSASAPAAAAAPVAPAPAATPATLPFSGAATAAPAAAAPDDPDAGDIAAQCAKRFAAMKACDQVPSLGRNVCRAQVNRTYSHIACAIIQ